MKKVGVFVLAAAWVGCGRSDLARRSNAPHNTVVPGRIALTLSGTAACGAPVGPFRAVWIAVSGAATRDSRSGAFADLAPRLAFHPQLINLLARGTGACAATTLATARLAPGHYDELRLTLAPAAVAATLPGNPCGAAGECVVLKGGAVAPLEVNGETIVIPPARFTGGGFLLRAGELQSVDIAFDACATLAPVATALFRWRPAPSAGVIGAQSMIAGRVVAATATSPATAPLVVFVALEQDNVQDDALPSASGVDRVVRQARTDATGRFQFCPVPPGVYDVVATAVSGAGATYAATVTTGVRPGDQVNPIPLYLPGTYNTAAATISGAIVSPAPMAVGVSALEAIAGGTRWVTIPLAQQSTAVAMVATSARPACGSGSCGAYSLVVPAAPAYSGAFVGGGLVGSADYAPATDSPLYRVDLQPQGGSDCAGSDLQTSKTGLGQPLTAISGAVVTASTVDLGACH